jgi:hypothetical protein
MRFGVPAITILAGAALAPGSARADGTYFLVELNTGVGESAYESTIGLNYGVSAGVSFKLKALPIRWYVLASLIARNAWTSGSHEGLAFSASRTDLDAFGAIRSVLPVWRMLRIYAEFGIGGRHLFETVHRGDLGTLDARDTKLLFVVGLGLQARLTDMFSVGVRGEMTPVLGSEAEIAAYAADVVPTRNRISGFVTLGVHF